MYCRNPKCKAPNDIIEVPLKDVDGYLYDWDQQLCDDCRFSDVIHEEDVDRLTNTSPHKFKYGNEAVEKLRAANLKQNKKPGALKRLKEYSKVITDLFYKKEEE